MTVAKLLTNKRFIKFCRLRCNIEPNALFDISCADLYELMKKWHECPEALLGPSGVIREEIEKELEEV